jgi:arylsulfatase A-like enzyme
MARWSRRLGLVVAASLALVCAASAGAAPRARLNVVFIVSDDENVSGSAVMADVHRLLALHGVTFDDFRVTTSECGPSRASILTGLYSHHSGVFDNFGPHSYPAFDDRSDLPVWLHRAGYSTALVGKYLNDYTLDGDHLIPPGWTDWQAIDSVPEERYYHYTLNENGRLVHYGGKPADYSTTVLTGKAVSFLRSVRTPFFLYFAPVAPHLPAVPAPADVGRFDKLAPFTTPSLHQTSVSDEPWARWHSRAITESGLSYIQDVRRHQLEALQAVDRGVARIVRTLAQRHLLDRTVIFYTSDNGFLWGEHRLGGKIWPYEESTHVPLVVRTPWSHGATVSHDPVLNIDFASTIGQLAGIVPGGPQDGDSFVPLLRGRKVQWRRDYLIEYLGANKLRVGGPPPYVAIHTRRYLYVQYRYRHWRELYDLRNDPWELRNVVGEPFYRGVIATLSERLKDLFDDPAHAAPQREALARS